MNEWVNIVKKCQKFFSSIERNFSRTVELRLKLGEFLLQIDRKYGGRVMERLASDISKATGYNIHPQRLYEYMKVAKHFNSVDEIFETAGTKDLTWTDVLRLCGVKRQKKLLIVITIGENDKDLLRYKILPPSKRNEFLKEALRFGIRTVIKARKLPEIT